MATLREQLAQPGSFVVATEIVTSRGLVTANRGGVLDLARELADDPRIDVPSITDDPGGNAYAESKQERGTNLRVPPEVPREPPDAQPALRFGCAVPRDRPCGLPRAREGTDGPVVVKDNPLAGTSAWANTFLGRVHVAREIPA